ncbi:hypothetical protein OAF27_02380 [Verrucomicrobiales bacterium]|nr:hypothetical protein [Verrucomicrobiales bacterium]
MVKSEILRFPGEAAIRHSESGNDAMLLPLALVPPEIQGATAYVPAFGSSGDANETIAAIESYWNSGSKETAGAILTGFGLRKMAESREFYLSRLEQIVGIWEEQGSIVDDVVASKFSAYRSALRSYVRERSAPTTVPYRLLDASRIADRKTRWWLFENGFLAKERLPRYTAIERLAIGQNKSVLEGIGKSNKTTNAIAKVAGKTGKFLTRSGGIIVAGIPISIAAAKAYQAEGKEEQQKALEELKREGVSAAAGGIVGAVSASLCVAVGLSTGGWGFLSCGLLSSAVSFAAGAEAEKLYDQIQK